MPNRSLCIAALLLLSASALAQDKTLTFDNADPDTTVHLLNGTSVSIGTTGNLVAKCVLNGTKCVDIGSGTGGGGAVPTVSLAKGGFNTAPDGNGAYSAGTTFTITPTVTNASVCWRHVIAGPLSGTWTGAVAANLSTAVPGILLGTANTSYTYRLDCYNDSGSAGAEVTVTTNAGAPPPPTGCQIEGWIPTLSEYGFTQATLPNSWLQLQGSANFPNSNIFSTSIVVPKSTLSGLVYLGAERAKWTSVAFTTPSSGSGDLIFNDSQVPQTSTSHLGSYYVTISSCPGDFRYAIQNPSESTEYQACKAFRKTPQGAPYAVEGLRWSISSVSGDGFANNTCGLQANKTYYINYANVNPHDGLEQQEHGCPNNLSNCGLQFKSN